MLNFNRVGGNQRQRQLPFTGSQLIFSLPTLISDDIIAVCAPVKKWEYGNMYPISTGTALAVLLISLQFLPTLPNVDIPARGGATRR